MDKISQPKIEFRDPRQLRVHRLAKLQPGEWSDDSTDFRALCDDIQARGIDAPLLITAANEVADGRHRLRGALRYELREVPCRVITEDEVANIIIQTLLRRRHFTSGQRAYLIAPHLESAFVYARQRMMAGKGIPSAAAAKGQETPEMWAEKIGVSVRLLRNAYKVWKLFEDDTKREFNDEKKPLTFREYFEPRILESSRSVDLDAVIRGITGIVEAEKKGKPHKGGKPANVERQLTLFNNVIKDELNRWEYWQKFDDETKAEHFAAVRAQVAQIDDAEQLEQMAEYHSKLAHELRKAAKEAAAANGGK